MEILYVILGLAIVGALVYLISELRKLQQPQDGQSQKLMLDVMEKLRVSVQDGDDKTRKTMQDQLDKMTNSYPNIKKVHPILYRNSLAKVPKLLKRSPKN